MDNIIYLGVKGSITAIDSENGSELWRTHFKIFLDSSLSMLARIGSLPTPPAISLRLISATATSSGKTALPALAMASLAFQPPHRKCSFKRFRPSRPKTAKLPPTATTNGCNHGKGESCGKGSKRASRDPRLAQTCLSSRKPTINRNCSTSGKGIFLGSANHSTAEATSSDVPARPMGCDSAINF